MHYRVSNFLRNQTPREKKRIIIKNWVHRGLKFSNACYFENTEQLFRAYSLCTECNYCGKQFTCQKDKHMDHDHRTGLFRWFLCCKCNANCDRIN